MEKNITTKFQDFKNKEVNNFNKTKEYKTLSDDIIVLSKLDDGNYEKIEGDVSIVQVLGIVDNPIEIDNIERTIKENLTIDTSLSIKNIKRGQTLWLTALLQKGTNTQTFSSQTIGVIKVRVIDYFHGTSKLNNLVKK